MKNRLKRIQYRPALIDGFLAQTGLSIEPQPQGSGVFRTYGGLSGMHGCGAESHGCEHGHAT